MPGEIGRHEDGSERGHHADAPHGTRSQKPLSRFSGRPRHHTPTRGAMHRGGTQPGVEAESGARRTLPPLTMHLAGPDGTSPVMSDPATMPQPASMCMPLRESTGRPGSCMPGAQTFVQPDRRRPGQALFAMDHAVDLEVLGHHGRTLATHRRPRPRSTDPQVAAARQGAVHPTLQDETRSPPVRNDPRCAGQRRRYRSLPIQIVSPARMLPPAFNEPRASASTSTRRAPGPTPA